MNINERGYWESETGEGHGVDPCVAAALLSFFSSEVNGDELSIIDIGCGTGYYTKILNMPFYKLCCSGYDGNPNTPKLTGGLCGVADFTRPQWFGLHDWVLSLEVGEHIPPEYEMAFVHNLIVHNRRGIVLSWAIDGQGGDGHINCHDNEYVKRLITGFGYTNDTEVEKTLRNSASKCYWFADTIMVFRRGYKC